ncbi:DNA cytosine methyltransferase [Nocardiopsis sp. NPDC006198]|uniref:DNA cytosine methyltransferase n=1 Tax=Nocardiopsis sp. NPDC006198 TaxID=3154472 RepID=UPI00339FBE78
MSKQHYGVPLERSDYLRLPVHPSSRPRAEFGSWLESIEEGSRLAVDLFSGAGGLSLGLERAGWLVAAAVDIDERALETHSANFAGLSLRMDLGDPAARDELVKILQPASIDLVAGGPPCQPFSRAGRSKIRSLVEHHGRDPEDRRKELWGAYLDVVKRLQPRVVLMENVPDMGLGDDFFVVRTIEQQLEDLGYATQVKLVDAWRYGVPQHRKRLILLARNDVEEFPWQEEQAVRTTLRDAIGDLPRIDVVPTERVGERELSYKRPRKLPSFAQEMREGATRGVVWDHMTRRVRKDDWEIFSGMDSRTLYSDIDPRLRRYKADQFTDKYKKLDWSELSRTITAHIAKDGYWYIHPEQNRTLTVREAARIQTFPDAFRFAGTRSDAFRQIGNAVPPLLGEAAARALLPSGLPKSSGPLQPRWRTVRADLTTWAEQLLEQDERFQLPGNHMTPLLAAVAALLSGARLKAGEVARIARAARGRKRPTQEILDELLAVASTKTGRARLGRLEAWVSAEAPNENTDVPVLLGMKPAERRLYRLLLGDDLLWLGQGALRVAARLNDSRSDVENRYSLGRVDLLKLVGSGRQAALRMSAVRLIGETACGPSLPLCPACPLSQHCPSRGRFPEPLFVETSEHS